MLIVTNRLRKITALFIVALLIFVQTSCAFAAQSESDQSVTANSFSDLSLDHWAYKNIQTLVGLGGITGYPDGTFKPEGSITYAELCSILLGANGYDTTVPSGTNWAQGVLQKAIDAKIVDKSVIPLTDAGKPVTRDKMALILSNSATELRDEELKTFSDISEYVRDWSSISSVYQPYVNQAVAAGLIQGDTNANFNASKNLTRAEASTIAVRLLDVQSRLEPSKFSNDSESPTGTFTEAEKKAATASQLIEAVEAGRATITKYTSAEQFVKDNGATYREGSLGYRYVEFTQPILSIGTVVNGEYYGTESDNLQRVTDKSYGLEGTYIQKNCTGLTVADSSKYNGYIIVVGNPFKLLGL